MGRDAAGIVVRERHVVHLTGRKVCFIFLGDIHHDAFLVEDRLCIAGVVTAHKDIREQIESRLRLLLQLQEVVGIAGIRIGKESCTHAADFVVRVDLMSQLHHLCRGHQLIVDLFIAALQIGRCLVDHLAQHQRNVDLIEGVPDGGQTLVLSQADPCKLDVFVDQLPVRPAAPVLDVKSRHIVLVQRDHRLDAIFPALFEHIAVELHAFLVHALFHTVGVNACPGDREIQRPEAHLTQQGDVLLVVMVEIRCLVVGVKNAILQDVLCPFGQHAAHHRNLALGAVRHPIAGHTHAVLICPQKIVCLRGRLAVLIPGTFDLRSADVAAPQKILRKCHIIYSPCW